MSNGKAATTQAFLLAALLASIGGCDSEAQPYARYQMDVVRNRAWSLSAGGLSFHDRSAPGKTVQVPLPGWHWAGPPYGCLPDLALGPKGEAVVTSDVLPTLWRIDAETLAVSVHPLALDADMDKDVGFSAITYSSRHGAYYALSQTPGAIWKIDPLFRRAQKTPLAAPVVKACGPAVRPSATFLSLPDL